MWKVFNKMKQFVFIARDRCALIRLTRGESANDDSVIGEFPAGCGVMLYGPLGCGKRTLSRWFAAECRSRLVSIDCAQASGRLSEDLSLALDKARSSAPCVVYLANVDAVNDSKGLRKIAAALDAVDCTSQTMIIASTSFPDQVDRSLTAPGRFSEQVLFVYTRYIVVRRPTCSVFGTAALCDALVRSAV